MAIRLAIIGAGNMGGSILRGLLHRKDVADARDGEDPLLTPEEIVVCETEESRRIDWRTTGIQTTASVRQAVAALDGPRACLLLAIKPQSFPAVAAEIRGRIPLGGSVISIMAGAPIAVIGERLDIQAGVIRAMPNLPAQIMNGLTAIAAGPGVTPPQLDFAERLFRLVGETIAIEESLMDAFTAMAGSGPAYLFYLAEAMSRAGEAMGFDPGVADRAARATLAGAAAMLAHDPRTAAQLRSAVTSRGGTTEAAIGVLDDRDVMASFVDAIVRGRDRARELAGG